MSLSLSEQLRPMQARMRLTLPRIRHIVQITAYLRGDAEAGALRARGQVLRWLSGRIRPKRLPSDAWDGDSFELEVAPGHLASVVWLQEPWYWVMRLDHPDHEVAGRTWSTEITVGFAAERAQFGVRLTRVSRGDDPASDSSTPGIVRQVAEGPGLDDNGVEINEQPWILESATDVDLLIDLLQDPARRRPVYVVSLPDGETDPNLALIDVHTTSRRCLGIAHVVVLSSPLSFELTDRVGREHSVFSGAVRSYMPGFAVEDQLPRRHPLALTHKILSWNDGAKAGFETFLVERAYEISTRAADLYKRLPTFTFIKKLALERQNTALSDEAPAAHRITILDAQLQELRRDNEEWEAIVESEMNHRTGLESELDRLQAQNSWMRAEIDRLWCVVRDAGDDPESTVPTPSSLDDLAEWAHQALPGRLTLHPRAVRSAQRSLFENVSLVYDALRMLATEYREMKTAGSDNKRCCFEERAKALGLKCEPTFSGSNWGMFGDTYGVDWRGQKRLLEMHLKKGGNTRDPRRCLRIYFFWDDDEKQVVVGSLPRHLENRAT